MDKRSLRRRVTAGAAGVVAVGALISLVIGSPDSPDQSSTAAKAGRSLDADLAPSPVGRQLSASSDDSAAVEASTAAQSTGASGDESVSGLPPGIGSPKVVKTASVEVEVAKGGFAAAFSKVSTIAAAHGGFVASSTSSHGAGGDDNGQAVGTLVVRVPAGDFDVVRRELIDLGELRSEQISGEDVGAQIADLDARLRNLRSQEEAIRLLMTKATTVGETLEVQRQLSGVREQIERLSAEQARLGDAVALSTLTVSLAEPGAASPREGEGSPIVAAFARALDGAEAVVVAVIVSLGYLLPLGALLALGWLAAKPLLKVRRAGT